MEFDLEWLFLIAVGVPILVTIIVIILKCCCSGNHSSSAVKQVCILLGVSKIFKRFLVSLECNHQSDQMDLYRNRGSEISNMYQVSSYPVSRIKF